MHSSQLSSSTAVRGLSVARPAMRSRRTRPALPTRAVSEPSSSVPFTATAAHLNDWTPNSWRDFTALQQPNYPDEAALRAAVGEIERMPPLVFAGETRTLQDRLAAAARGDAFLVQGGDCAESFEQFSTNKVRDLYRLLLQMSVVVQYGGGMPVVKIARLAGTSEDAELLLVMGVAGCRLGEAGGARISSLAGGSRSNIHLRAARLDNRSICQAALGGFGDG